MKAKTLLAAVALSTISTGALAYPKFTIEECTLACGGGMTYQLTADQINGSYAETITATISGDPLVDGTFVTSGVFQLSGYTLDGTGLTSYLQSPGGYDLYALFYFDGTNNLNAAGDLTFTANNATVELWGDPGQDSGFTQDATGVNLPTVTPGTADVQLGTASTLVAGSGNGRLGLNNGDFEIVLGDFALTPAGENFFIEPTDFYVVLDVNGNFQDVNPDFAVGTGTYLVTGAGQVFFAAVPEPSVMALFATGLLGLGFAARRRRQV
ncbi:flocculation-associated PEP-CTERM protein PepA [Haliea sp. E1-2-M8]|uniref:flocculation-associated PEP-CTERM protein PepA n=1 Tax=Haliea sp. E1-2-M8 TaxID=3064706 RepID=UPI002727D3D9|nr:flocculation-associated PEP-CTERM protein PepA [Haliea sp. E1-2-M8]MDO8863755.1 flocculation-associated PEP-CTERM protein PepA [Haliea sp. E1-2-M8]